MEITLKIKKKNGKKDEYEDKTFVMPMVMGRMFRKSMELGENIDFDKMKTKELDEIIDVIVELYGNRFSRDEFYDGIATEDLMPTVMEQIEFIASEANKKINKFPIKNV